MIATEAQKHAEWMRALLQGYHMGLAGIIALERPSTGMVRHHARTHADLLLAALRDALRAAGNQARSDACLAPLSADWSHFGEEGSESLLAIVHADARSALRTIQTFALREQLMGHLPHAMARLGARGELPGQDRNIFVQLDKAQRRFSSDQLLANTVRGLMFRCYGHTFADGLAESGISRFVASRDGAQALLDYTSNWSEWAAAELHPNCPWTLSREATP